MFSDVSKKIQDPNNIIILSEYPHAPLPPARHHKSTSQTIPYQFTLALNPVMYQYYRTLRTTTALGHS